MSRPKVESASAPLTLPRLRIGTATETMVESPLLTQEALCPASASAICGSVLPLAGKPAVDRRGVAARSGLRRPQQSPERVEPGFLLLIGGIRARRRQAEVQGLGVEQEVAVRIVDARARLRRADELMQDRADLFRIDRELDRLVIALRGPLCIRRRLQQLVGIDLDGVLVDAG